MSAEGRREAAVIEVEGLGVTYGAAPARLASSTMSDSASPKARSSVWSANPAVARARSAQPCWGWSLSPGRIVAGSIEFEGRNLVGLPEAQLRSLRGRKIAMIAQDALAVLNPVVRVGSQVGDVARDHGERGDVEALVQETLRRVRLPRPELTASNYPHELSGGMQQRVVIGEGLMLGPRLLIADEPTTALDVTLQSQILDLLLGIRDESGAAILLITHDLAAVADVCDRVMVMYGGRIVETGGVAEIFDDPRHPYTRALLAALLPLKGEPPKHLDAIPGQPPRPGEWTEGCRFRPRCPLWADLARPGICAAEEPTLTARREGLAAACHFSDLAEVEATRSRNRV